MPSRRHLEPVPAVTCRARCGGPVTGHRRKLPLTCYIRAGTGDYLVSPSGPSALTCTPVSTPFLSLPSCAHARRRQLSGRVLARRAGRYPRDSCCDHHNVLLGTAFIHTRNADRHVCARTVCGGVPDCARRLLGERAQGHTRGGLEWGGGGGCSQGTSYFSLAPARRRKSIESPLRPMAAALSRPAAAQRVPVRSRSPPGLRLRLFAASRGTAAVARRSAPLAQRLQTLSALLGGGGALEAVLHGGLCPGGVGASLKFKLGGHVSSC